ncbi:MAG: hypothetical protein OEZ43_12655 [Gammaproteobacteria bacterium]|nr:hypothetical protein [Gammaproteobacteria bacterium]
MQNLNRLRHSIFLLLLGLVFLSGSVLADHLNGNYVGLVDGDKIVLKLAQKQNRLSGELRSDSGEKLTLVGEVEAEGTGLFTIHSTNPSWENMTLRVEQGDQQSLDLVFMRPDPFFGLPVPVSQASVTRQRAESPHEHENTSMAGTPQRSREHSRKKSLINGKAINTTGVIASMAIPQHWKYEYNAEDDVIVINDGSSNIISIKTALSVIDPLKTLKKIIDESKSSCVEPDTVGQSPAAICRQNVEGEGEVLTGILNKDEISIFFIIASKGTAIKAKSHLSAIIDSMVFTSPRFPRDMHGVFLVRHSYSNSRGMDPMSVGSRSTLSLHPNGELTRRWRIAGGNSVSYLGGNQDTAGGSWEVRGTRLLMRKPGIDDVFSYRHSVVGEGIALYGAAKEPSYLIRQ